MKSIIIMVILIAAIGITSSCTSRQNVAINHKDSVEYAVYASQPIIYNEDCDPLYIPMDLLGLHQPGDTVLVDTNYRLVQFPIRDAETRQPVMSGLHKVKVQERLDYNKWLAQ